MTKNDIIRAWKDREFRNQLSAEQRASLPVNPAGPLETPESSLDKVSGACTEVGYTYYCCADTNGAGLCSGRDVDTFGCCDCNSDILAG
jgi:mersacidin/lichenicidin family type 2 lantibiotic